MHAWLWVAKLFGSIEDCYIASRHGSGMSAVVPGGIAVSQDSRLASHVLCECSRLLQPCPIRIGSLHLCAAMPSMWYKAV